MYRIGGSLRYVSASLRGGTRGIPPLLYERSNPEPLSGSETVSGRQFDWGGRLLKSNGGAQRFPQNGWKSFEECKGIRELDCETNKSSRDRKSTRLNSSHVAISYAVFCLKKKNKKSSV